MDSVSANSGNMETDNCRSLVQKFRTAVEDILEPHHDDRFLYKWLKARDFDITKAEKMIRESFKFRKKIGADTILTEYSLPEVYHKYGGFTTFLGFDKENSPIRLLMIGLCDAKGFVYSLPLVDCLKLMIYLLESDIKRLKDREKEIGPSDEKIVFILDYTNFSLKRFYDKRVVYTGIQVLKMYQDNYPEIMKAAYLVNVPSYFNWLFGLFKPFLNHVTLSKIKVFSANEYKQLLRKIINPELLPAFMGGDRTDPDGNPKCHTLIDWDPKVDPSYYMKQNIQNQLSEDSSMKVTTIHARSVFRIAVDVKMAGSVLKWKFRTKDYNIRFGLFFQADSSPKLEELLPIEVIDCQLIPEDNEFGCDKAGTYVLHFDNTFSWLTSKRIWYKVDVERENCQ